MALQDILLQAAGGGAVDEIAKRFGIAPAVAQSAIAALAPAVAGGFKTQARQAGGLEALLGQVVKPDVHAAYLDDARAVGAPAATDVGNMVLGAIFGSKDVSRGVAANAAQTTGIDPAILRQILPVVAAMAAGALAKGGAPAQASGGGVLGQVIGGLMGGGQAGAPAAGGLGGLAQMLDLDKDGNPLDDIMAMLNRR